MTKSAYPSRNGGRPEQHDVVVPIPLEFHPGLVDLLGVHDGCVAFPNMETSQMKASLGLHLKVLGLVTV